MSSKLVNKIWSVHFITACEAQLSRETCLQCCVYSEAQFKKIMTTLNLSLLNSSEVEDFNLQQTPLNHRRRRKAHFILFYINSILFPFIFLIAQRIFCSTYDKSIDYCDSSYSHVNIIYIVSYRWYIHPITIMI